MKEDTGNGTAVVDGHHRTQAATSGGSGGMADPGPFAPLPKPFDMDAERYRLRLQGLHFSSKAERNRAKRLRRAFRGEIFGLKAPNGLRTAGLFWRGGGHPTKSDRAAIQRFLRAWLLGPGAPQGRRGHP